VDFLLVLTEPFSLGVTAESLQAKTDRKSAISLQRGHFDPKFQVEAVAPLINLTNLLLTIFTQRNFVTDFLQAKCDFFTEIVLFALLRPPNLRATYDDYLRLIGKRVPISVH